MSYSLYVHIPFCKQRCLYCDFYSSVGAAVPEAYVEGLKKAFLAYAPPGERPATIYFGGGTPGLLAPGQVSGLLALFSPAKGAEVTLEVNPEGVSEGQLAAFRAAGVNRISVGVQTARDASLARLGRLHNGAQAARALRMVKAAGFDDVSADIMLALPGYSRDEFDETLALAAENGATHISAYLLKVEENTAFGRNTPAGLPDADAAADFYLYAVSRLEAGGYHQYEISNFARLGRESRHNLAYWRCENYLGLGPAAHSCMENRRFYFPPGLEAFLAGDLTPVEDGKCTAEDYLLLSLRLAAGLDEAEWAGRFGGSFSPGQRKTLEALAGIGLARSTPWGVALTPEGFLVQNSILAALTG